MLKGTASALLVLLLFARSINKQDPGARLLVERGDRIQEIVVELI